MKPDEAEEHLTAEGCRILESWNDRADAAVSIARARVAPGVTTKLHRLHGVTERYVVLQGTGVVRIGEAIERDVGPGDVAIIPPLVPQQVANTGADNLIFYCVCTPRFTEECYESLE